MKKLIFTQLVLFLVIVTNAQEAIQNLLPNRVSIFKNGTYFIKQSNNVNVTNKQFTIAAPQNVILGTYWLSTKEATLKTIKVKLDTLKVWNTAKSISDYCEALIDKKIVLNEHGLSSKTLSGTVISFNKTNKLLKLKDEKGNFTVVNINDYDQISYSGADVTKVKADKIEPLALVTVNEDIKNTIATTLSLHTGMSWTPSYLFTIINEKEATLSLKATIMNGSQDYKNTDVDIVIGSPEMFYGKNLDPIAVNYLSQSVGRYDNVSMLNTYSFYQSRSNNTEDEEEYENEEPEYDEKKGDKLEDLFIYKLGKLDLDAYAKTIIPIKKWNLTYEDIYTTFLNTKSANTSNIDVINIEHRYRIKNENDAPLTTGSVLVLNKEEQAMAQTEIKYTPVNAKQTIKISNAIDVMASNSETEVKREDIKIKVGKKMEDAEKITYEGTVKITNAQNKKIKLSLSKAVAGEVNSVTNNGNFLKGKETNNQSPISVISWELEINPKQDVEIKYVYTVIEK